MNKSITQLISATLALSVWTATAQDARPTLTSPSPAPAASPTPTPVPSAAANDESIMAGDTSKVNEDLLANDPVLAGNNRSSGPANDPFAKLDIKRPFAAQPPSPANGITLDQAIQTALEHNADILRQIAEIKRTLGQVVEVRAQALPQLGVSSGYSQSKTLSSGSSSSSSSSLSSSSRSGSDPNVIGTVLIDGVALPVTSTSSLGKSLSTSGASASTENKSWNVNFEVTQVIYSGGQVSAALRAARIAEDSAFYQLRNVVDQVIASVRQQFYTVLLNRALISVQEESVTLLQSQLRDQQNRFEAGTVPRFNVLRAEVELANARPALIRARNNYRTSQLQLAKLVGVSWPTTGDLTPFPIKGLLTYDAQVIDLQESIRLAMERRALLKVQRQSILSEVEQITVALAGYQPTINGNAGYQIRNASGSLSDEVDGWFFGFSGNWNIFDGFATSGRVQQARARLESARVNYEDSVRQVELEVQTSYSSLIEGRELIESQQKAVEQAQEALRLARERFSAGAGTQLEVLDARVSLTQAQTTALQAVADYNSALAEFDRVTGSVTHYHDTFADPLASKGARKKWISSAKKLKPTLTDDEIRANLVKRRQAQ
ncbi:MAG: TolC family protein [Chthoniobacterales bacterium]